MNGLSKEQSASREKTLLTALLLSAPGPLVVALSRLSVFEPGGNVTVGLTIAVLGLVTNGWFWWRYTVLTREQYSAVIAAQQQLYRAKASVDLCVVAALAAVAIAPAHPATHYVDLLGSVMVAIYLLWSGLRSAQTHFARPVEAVVQ